MHNWIKQRQAYIVVSRTVAMQLVGLLLFWSLCPGVSATPLITTEVDGKKVTGSILIDAPQETVFDEIRKERTNHPGVRKLISFEGHRAVVEQKFLRLPILGTAVCIYEEVEQPYSRIDMKMIKSDKFKHFEGYWLLDPKDSGKQTLTTLSLLCDTGLYIPFSEQITVNRTKSAVWRRLYAIKAAAEKDNNSSTTTNK